MSMRSNIIALALSALAALAFSSLTASAAVVCNASGVCWHTHANYTFPPDVHVVIHPNGWHWGHGQHFVWREHGGPGYWRNGVWINLP